MVRHPPAFNSWREQEKEKELRRERNKGVPQLPRQRVQGLLCGLETAMK